MKVGTYLKKTDAIIYMMPRKGIGQVSQETKSKNIQLEQ